MTTRTAPAPIFTDISAATPAEIDYHLAHLEAESYQLDHGLVSLRRELGHAEEIAQGYGPRYGARKPRPVAEIAELIQNAEFRLTEIRHHFVTLNAEYARRGGWPRYYLVEDGHLHYDVSGSRCSRIPSTTHYWMTDFSGEDSAKVIELAGERVCTTCFPDAPVKPRPASVRFMTRTEAERAAYAEDKARKVAARKAAQITTPEGGELRVPRSFGGTDHVKTERAAWNRAMADATTIAWYGTKDSVAEREAVELCLAALAHRRGVTVDSLRTELNKKIATKGRREGFTVLATI
ncbi:hypothetical protein [Actinophytocola sp.]|uniref:hypothetical protein n=1 Tax=Actinophytocola sp. TaxID=1872138 RepID=UPI002D7F65E9|nr:hypothetical protein [Actinophytocola sp.]HET9144043.1 hypothetical protein [Actinophytocola sp.]